MIFPTKGLIRLFIQLIFIFLLTYQLENFINERQEWADYYRRELANIEWLRMPVQPIDGQHAWQAFVTYVDPAKAPMSRNDMMERLQAVGIATRPGTHAVHMLGYYKNHYGFTPESYPGAFDCDSNTMAIPLHNRMKKEDYAYVVRSLQQISL